MKDHPELWVTIKELILKDNGDMAFTATKFCLQGLRVRVNVELIGPTAEIVEEIGSQAALKLLDKVGVSSAGMGEFAGKEFSSRGSSKQKLVPNSISLIEVKERPVPTTNRVGGGSGKWTGGSEHKSFEVLVTMNMARELGDDEEVVVEVNDFDTSYAPAKATLENQTIRKNIETALSSKATEVINSKINKKLEQFKPAN